MALIASHLPCNDCGSSDAKAEYEDNYYCFSCGVSTPKRKEKSFFEKPDNTPPTGDYVLRLPSNATRELPLPAMKWLLSNYIDEDLQKQYGIKYVHQATVYTKIGTKITMNERILLPCYKEGKLVWYQARSLNKNDQPKYYTLGDKQELFYTTTDVDDDKTLVITEDMLSAIRIGQHKRAVSLQGTSISDKNLLTLVQKYDTIIIWLDGDRPGQDGARKLVKKLSLLTNKVHNICTKRDPKCLADSEISSNLRKI